MAAQQAADRGPLVARITEAPLAREDARRLGALTALKEGAHVDAGLAPLAAALENPHATGLLAGVFSGSPYLSGLIEHDPPRLALILTTAPETRLDQLKSELTAKLRGADTRAAAMSALRQFK